MVVLCYLKISQSRARSYASAFDRVSASKVSLDPIPSVGGLRRAQRG